MYVYEYIHMCVVYNYIHYIIYNIIMELRTGKYIYSYICIYTYYVYIHIYRYMCTYIFMSMYACIE